MGSTVFWYTYYIMVDLRHWGYPAFEVFILAAHFPDNRLDLRGDGTASVLLDTTILSFQNGSFLPHLQMLFYPGHVDLVKVTPRKSEAEI